MNFWHCQLGTSQLIIFYCFVFCFSCSWKNSSVFYLFNRPNLTSHSLYELHYLLHQKMWPPLRRDVEGGGAVWLALFLYFSIWISFSRWQVSPSILTRFVVGMTISQHVCCSCSITLHSLVLLTYVSKWDCLCFWSQSSCESDFFCVCVFTQCLLFLLVCTLISI